MPAAAGRTVSVPFGAVTLTVVGVFEVPYQIKVTPSAPGGWVTDVDVRNKTATAYDLDFSVPAPASAVVDLVEVQAG